MVWNLNFSCFLPCVVSLVMLAGGKARKSDDRWLAQPIIVGGLDASGGVGVLRVLSELGIYMVRIMAFESS